MHLCVFTFSNGFAIGFDNEETLSGVIKQLEGLLEAKKTGKRRPGRARYAVWSLFDKDETVEASTCGLLVPLSRDGVSAAVALIGDEINVPLNEIEPLELLAMIEKAANDDGRDA